MAKANLTLPNGTIVVIEGSPEEVSALLAKVSEPSRSVDQLRSSPKKASGTTKPTKPARKGPQALLQELVDEDWFKSKRTISDVQKKLEEKGHLYALHSLSTPLLRLTRSRVLRRLKDKSGWVYVS
jgi:hypothetical protein